MSFATRHNKGNKFDVNFDGFEMKRLEDLFSDDPDAIYPVQALYITKKGEYGPSPFVVSDGFCVYLPGHMLEEIEGILASDDDIADIKTGKVGFCVYSYEKEVKKKMQTFYSINWCDVD